MTVLSVGLGRAGVSKGAGSDSGGPLSTWEGTHSVGAPPSCAWAAGPTSGRSSPASAIPTVAAGARLPPDGGKKRGPACGRASDVLDAINDR
jgi:hypothetical protein